jgi:hypothetical protein
MWAGRIFFWSLGHPAKRSKQPAVAHQLRPYQSDNLAIFLFFYFILIFWSYEEVWGWAWHFGRMGVQHPPFLNLAPTLRKVKSSILHGAWRFYFFQILFFLKLE